MSVPVQPPAYMGLGREPTGKGLPSPSGTLGGYRSRRKESAEKQMTVFISHSFDNRPEFDNIAEALAAAKVPYWNPADVKPGSSLRDQLRQAVDDCAVCIFIATRWALESSWCDAELGAFWGAGKPVIVYLAEASLKDNELPPMVQGDVWERSIKKVVARAGELVEQARSASGSGGGGGAKNVGNMTKDELEQIIIGALSLATATAKSESGGATYEQIGQAAKRAAGSVAEGIRDTQRITEGSDDGRRRCILWVDDRPNNNVYERRAMETLGVTFTLALSTKDALEILAEQRFAAIISDMGRKEGPSEGYVLLEALRTRGDQTPFFIYAGSNAPKHKREAERRGAQGNTNVAQELFDMIVQVLH
jgi:CheY-like chemotaxis protein